MTPPINSVNPEPCPWHGDATDLGVEDNGVGCFWIICGRTGCGCEGPYAHSEAEAWEKWNNRVALPSQVGVSVKSLEWRPIGPGASDVDAETPFGTYTMSFDAPTAGGAVNLWMVGADNDTFSVHERRKDAEAAAQADFNARIQSCLTSPAAEPVAWSIPAHAKWCQPGDRQDKRMFLVRFDDPDCREAVFTDEAEARAFYAKATVSWNCYLFGTLEAHPTPSASTEVTEASPPPVDGMVLVPREMTEAMYDAAYALYDGAGVIGLQEAWAAFLSAAPQSVPPSGGPIRYFIEHDGFVGTVIGRYTRLDGKSGVVMQQDGTNIVHVYGSKWLKPAGPPALRPTSKGVEVSEEMVERAARAMALDQYAMGDPPAVVASVVDSRWREFKSAARLALLAALNAREAGE